MNLGPLAAGLPLPLFFGAGIHYRPPTPSPETMSDNPLPRFCPGRPQRKKG